MPDGSEGPDSGLRGTYTGVSKATPKVHTAQEIQQIARQQQEAQSDGLPGGAFANAGMKIIGEP